MQQNVTVFNIPLLEICFSLCFWLQNLPCLPLSIKNCCSYHSHLKTLFKFGFIRYRALSLSHCDLFWLLWSDHQKNPSKQWQCCTHQGHATLFLRSCVHKVGSNSPMTEYSYIFQINKYMFKNDPAITPSWCFSKSSNDLTNNELFNSFTSIIKVKFH